MLNFEFEKFWNLVNKGQINESNLDMKEIQQGKYRFLAIWSNMAGGRHLLGEYRNLLIYSRRQSWARFHLVLNPKDVFIVGRWAISQQDINDALHFANEFKYVLTFATYKSGATFPESTHFQAIPSRIEGSDFGKAAEFKPFQCLFEVKGDKVVRKENFIIELINPPDYPILCARIEGKLGDVALIAFSLITGYDNQRSVNLIIEPLEEKEQAKLYLFPRRFDGKVFPDILQKYGVPISFGAFEIGCVFPLRGEKRRLIYDNIEREQLVQAMKEVAVVNGSPEETCFINLVKLL